MLQALRDVIGAVVCSGSNRQGDQRRMSVLGRTEQRTLLCLKNSFKRAGANSTWNARMRPGTTLRFR
jgi:hypothetical protein